MRGWRCCALRRLSPRTQGLSLGGILRLAHRIHGCLGLTRHRGCSARGGCLRRAVTVLRIASGLHRRQGCLGTRQLGCRTVRTRLSTGLLEALGGLLPYRVTRSGRHRIRRRRRRGRRSGVGHARGRCGMAHLGSLRLRGLSRVGDERSPGLRLGRTSRNASRSPGGNTGWHLSCRHTDLRLRNRARLSRGGALTRQSLPVCQSALKRFDTLGQGADRKIGLGTDHARKGDLEAQTRISGRAKLLRQLAQDEQQVA